MKNHELLVGIIQRGTTVHIKIKLDGEDLSDTRQFNTEENAESVLADIFNEVTENAYLDSRKLPVFVRDENNLMAVQ